MQLTLLLSLLNVVSIYGFLHSFNFRPLLQYYSVTTSSTYSQHNSQLTKSSPNYSNRNIASNNIFSYTKLSDKSKLSSSTEKENELLLKNLTLGFSQLKPFLDIAVPFFTQDKKARNGLLGVCGLTLLNSGVSVAFSFISRDFYNALNVRDEQLFYEKVEYFFLALLVAVPISVYYQFIRQKLALYWRESLTEKILNLYLNNKKYYEMEMLRDIDNPDQRIAILYQIYPGLFLAIIGYAGIGSVITTNLGRSLVQLNYEKLQREATFRFSLIRLRENSESVAFYDRDAKLEKTKLWSLFQDIVNTQVGIINVKRNIETFTVAYRYLVQILPSLIVAPLYFQKKVELGTISQSYGAFNHILNDFSIIINQFESISAFSAGITRLTFFLDRLQHDSASHSIYTEENLTNCNRNIQFYFETNQDRQSQASSAFDTNYDARKIIFKVDDLTVSTPDRNRVIIGGTDERRHSSGIDASSSGVSVTVYRGDKLLIVGPSGCGKSSFLRAIGGLWQAGSGSITWYDYNTSNINLIKLNQKHLYDTENNNNNYSSSNSTTPSFVFFLPQKPYNVLGTLKDQIRYPKISTTALSDESAATVSIHMNNNKNDNNDDDFMYLDILRQVRLDKLAYRIGSGGGGGNSCYNNISNSNNNDRYEQIGLNTARDWSKLLSLGEQQRLAFARVLYNQPSVVFLDEATSALDLQSEQRMYELLQMMNITYLSVGHRPSLLKYHNKKLILQSDYDDIDGKEKSKQNIKIVEIDEYDESQVFSNSITTDGVL